MNDPCFKGLLLEGAGEWSSDLPGLLALLAPPACPHYAKAFRRPGAFPSPGGNPKTLDGMPRRYANPWFRSFRCWINQSH